MQLPSDWNNFEMTGYVKLNQGTNDDFTWYGRGGKHNNSNIGCEGSSYKGVLEFDGGNRLAKERYHVQYAFTSLIFNTPPLLDNWIGFKYVVYDKHTHTSILKRICNIVCIPTSIIYKLK